MRRRVALACLLAVGMAALVCAQEGYPLSGTWSGDWGPTAAQRTHLTIVLNWDGKAVTGTINPGPNAVTIGSVYLDVTNWTVRIEADAKDKSGATSHIMAEGRIEDLGAYHRRLVGTWTQGDVKGDFSLTRD